MLCVTCASILSRYILPFAWAFTEELVGAVFILLSLLGAAISMREGKSMGISAFTDLFPEKYQKFFALIRAAATFVFAGALFWYGIGMVRSEMKSGMRTAALNWPEAVFGSFVPIGAFSLAIACIQFAYKAWTGKKVDMK
jgi:TRAP-type C4-dicarboxylate transport system permease small subunit